MKNFYILSTDKPSRLVKIKDNLWYTTTENIPGGVYQHIYITNDEEIKDGWSYDRMMKSIGKRNNVYSSKIILTTDSDLIKDGVQAIDDEFLEWFVKNPSCEEVKVENEKYILQHLFKAQEYKFRYKIIIPKEELNLNCFDCNESLEDCTCMEDTINMKQETLGSSTEQDLMYQFLQNEIEL